MKYTIPCLDAATFLQILQYLAEPEKYTVTVPASMKDVKCASQRMAEEDGFGYIETTVDAPDDWDQVICQVSYRNPVQPSDSSQPASTGEQLCPKPSKSP